MNDEDVWGTRVPETEEHAVEESDTVQGSAPGQWLLLRDAVREIGSLERLYSLEQDAMLRSREESRGRIEVWVAARERYDGPSRSLGRARPVETAALGGATAGEVGQAVAALVESHAPQLDLARENGAPNEGLAGVERQSLDQRIRALREVAGAQKVSNTAGMSFSRRVGQLLLVLLVILVILAVSAGWMFGHLA